MPHRSFTLATNRCGHSAKSWTSRWCSRWRCGPTELWANRTLGHLILAGVFERHPSLRFVPTEQGRLWVPGQLGILDAMVPMMKSEAGNRTYGMFGGSSVDELTLTPSQYAQRNCCLASELTPFDSDMIDLWARSTSCGVAITPMRKASRHTPSSRSAGICTTSLKIPAENTGRQRGSALSIRPRRADGGRCQGRPHRHRGAHPARGHRLSRAGSVRVPPVRGRAGTQAADSGSRLGPIGIGFLDPLFHFSPMARLRSGEGAVGITLPLPERRIGLVDVLDQL